MKPPFFFAGALLPILATFALTSCGRDHPNLPELSVDHVYAYGDKVNFGTGGDAYRFRTTGWSNPEDRGTWTDGAAASLLFRLPHTGHALLLSARLAPQIKPPQLDAQMVHVYAGGRKIASWRVAGAGSFTAIIPPDLSSGGVLYLDFHIPGAISPQQLGTGSDARRLGVQCSEIVLSETDATENPRSYTLGTALGFGVGRGAERYEVAGWSAPEKEFTWTEGKVATLQFDVPAKPGPLQLRMRMRGIKRSAELPFQPTDVYVNGKSVAHWEVGGEPAEFTADIPAPVANESESLLVELRTPMAVAPKELGANADTRVLGVCVFELKITGSASP